jgi:hypothetical protein
MKFVDGQDYVCSEPRSQAEIINKLRHDVSTPMKLLTIVCLGSDAPVQMSRQLIAER